MAVAVGTAVVGPAAVPANAASTAWVYIAFPTWMGNCPNGGSVTKIQAYTDYWNTNWDVGDDLVYGKVALNQRNTIIAKVYCNKWPGYYHDVYRNDVVPTRGGQTLFVGPAGWSRN
ncbi:hypothetical protein [Embleya sp. NPDC020886]|uniref:hypothetical protein n=1 Tax=Embleya sp. NPDC020886 TaxID=3363980 RepID=UPI0037933331